MAEAFISTPSARPAARASATAAFTRSSQVDLLAGLLGAAAAHDFDPAAPTTS